MIYLDNSATTKPCQAALFAMRDALEMDWFNPSAAYGPAVRAEKKMTQARRMLLMTRNESTEFLWANTILRISALGQPGDDYPVTHARYHKNLLIVTDKGTAQKPKFNI